MSCYSRSSVLEDDKCPGKAFLRGELLGFVDKLQLPAPVSTVAASVEGRRVELESGARRLLGLLGLLEGSGELLQGLDQLLELRRGRRLLHGGDVLDDCLDLGGSGFRGCMELLGQVAYCGVEFCPMTSTRCVNVAMVWRRAEGSIYASWRPGLENGIRGGWAGDKSQKKENLRYPT